MDIVNLYEEKTLKKLNSIILSGKEVLPLIEGGKGINASNGYSSGAWAKENCVGTFSGVTPDVLDNNGNVIMESFVTVDAFGNADKALDVSSDVISVD